MKKKTTFGILHVFCEYEINAQLHTITCTTKSFLNRTCAALVIDFTYRGGGDNSIHNVYKNKNMKIDFG